MKLTKPQRALLDRLCAENKIKVVDSYPPAVALVKKGLAQWYTSKTLSSWLLPTEEGRVEVAEATKARKF